MTNEIKGRVTNLSALKKKKIRAHKGGRTARVDCRMTPAVKERFLEIAEARGVTPADLVEKWVLKSKL